MACFLSNQGVFSVVMKNCEPLVFGPALAILTVYGLSCFRDENSSSNSLPQMLSPPVPSPNGSPPWCCQSPVPLWMSQKDTYLNHEFTNDSVEDSVVVVAIFGMRHKVLDGLR